MTGRAAHGPRVGLPLLAAVLLLASALPWPAGAQDAPDVRLHATSVPVRVGDQVRARTSRGAVAGVILSVSADSLVLDPRAMHLGAPIHLRTDLIESVRVRLGDRPPENGLLLGAKRGFLLGAGLSAIPLGLGIAEDLGEECVDCWVTATELAAYASLFLVGITTVAGALIGAAWPGGYWRRGMLPASGLGSAWISGMPGIALRVRW